jgi:HPt (histidine-containing phosphotransfer) domain-containing protein
MAKPFEEPMLFKTVSKNIKKGIVMNIFTTTVENKPAQASGKLYDLSMVDAISGGDKSFTQRMLQLFLDTVPATLADMKSTCDNSEWMALSKHAHKLKSTIDSLNIASLKDVIREIEAKGKTVQDTEKIKVLVDLVQLEMQQVMEQVKSEL